MLDDSRPTSPENCAPAGHESAVLDESPIDLVHLARQCQGAARLEEELLGLFRRVAVAEVARLSDPSMGLKLKAEAAHKLRGSALAVGAGRVARAAGALEALARAPGCDSASSGQTGEVSGAIGALQTAVAEAVAEIERLRC